jgi:hypothetical protein
MSARLVHDAIALSRAPGSLSSPISPGWPTARRGPATGSGCATARAPCLPASQARAVFEPGAQRWRDPVLGEATLPPNGIARVAIETQQPLDADAAVRGRRELHARRRRARIGTVAAGMIRAGEPATD